MTYKESLHRIWLIAKREVHRLVAQPIYFSLYADRSGYLCHFLCIVDA